MSLPMSFEGRQLGGSEPMRINGILDFVIPTLDRFRLAQEFRETGVNKCRDCWVVIPDPKALFCARCTP